MNNISLPIGAEIDNNKLMDIFKCSNQGGMRKSNATNTLVLISSKNSIYKDSYEGDTIKYTGMGKKGDQSLSFMQNKTLAESNSNGIALHFFEKLNSIYRYYGKVKLIGDPYQAEQEDIQGVKRKVYIFPLKIID